MKVAFAVFNQFLLPEVMALLQTADIDYYTRWDGVKGKGRGTEPHLGKGRFVSENCALMIAFDDEGPLRLLVEQVVRFNAGVQRPDDRVRIFQLPLDLIV